ncbi:MAG: portal protein, partial [Pseudomonadota bacterium]
MATPDTYHDDMDDGGTPDEKIVKEAMRRFAVCATVENDCRIRFIEDIKFANGDADNLYQWDQTTRDARGYGTIDERPCLTINKVRQHNLNIINDAKQNKPSVKVKPVGNGATFEAAQVYEGICRHIEYISNAQAAYDTATTFQVQGGIGWIRVTTDYPDYNDQSFDQEI